MTAQTAAYWDWRREPIPDADMIVAAPALVKEAPFRLIGEVGERAQHRNLKLVLDAFVVVDVGMLITGLYVETQADLEGTPCHVCKGRYTKEAPCDACGSIGTIGGYRALLRSMSVRRALVLMPSERISLEPVVRYASIDAVIRRGDGMCPGCARPWEPGHRCPPLFEMAIVVEPREAREHAAHKESHLESQCGAAQIPIVACRR